jgi:DNA polymerase-1
MAKKNDKKRLVLLDSHAIIHRAYHALPEFSSSAGEPTGALYGLSTMLMKIVTDLKPDYIVAAYDLPKKTFRHEVYKEYKGGRAKIDEALIAQLKSSRKVFDAFNIPIYDCEGFEADDVLGTVVENLSKDNSTDIVIASGDMDTLQLVNDKKVQVFTLKKGLNDTILYDEEKVRTRFGFGPELLPDYKGLRGDPSDNIIGIKGIGEKTATTLISIFGTVENIYKALKKDKVQFKKVGITDRIVSLLEEGEEEALFSKTLATIRRDAPIKFKLPEKEFKAGIEISKLDKLFTELEFRSLIGRARTLFGGADAKSSGEKFDHTDSDDGLSSASVILENEENIDKNELAEASIVLWLINSDMADPSYDDILLYAKKNNFAEAKKVIFEKLEKEKGLKNVWEEIEKPIMPIIREMERVGVLIDKNFFKKLSSDYHKELDKRVEKIYKLAGGEFNINSPKQLSEILFDKLALKTKGKRGANGTFSTKIEVLEELEEGNPIITEIIGYRELQKLLSTYIDVIPAMAGDDGRLHTTFLQNGSTTGRFSSNNPNLQNIPIKSDLGKAIRNGFVARKGTKLVAFDYSQIELRVVAMLSKDKNLVEIFKEGKDVHTGVASFVFGVPQDKVDSEMRRRAKVINFGIIYGMGVSALKKNLGTSREDAQNFYNNYFQQFSGVREYLDSVKVFALQHGYTETLFGRKRQFQNIKSKIPFIRAMAERTATNAPLQGTAADIIKLAIRFAYEKLVEAGLEKKAQILLQIHDELIFEVEDAVVEKASKIIKDAMESVLAESFLHYKTTVPLLVHYGAGKNWGEVK